MNTNLAEKNCTREEYLAQEKHAEIKHEFFQGEIFAISGGTFNHSAIAVNISTTLKNRLRGKNCTPMNSDMRIHTPSGLDTYPDVSVFCGAPELQDDRRTLLNPMVIIEVLSPTTRDYDRGGKFTLYRSIPTLRDYVLADSEQMFVEHFRRADNGEWILREHRELGDSVWLTAVEEPLQLQAMYENVEFGDARAEFTG